MSSIIFDPSVSTSSPGEVAQAGAGGFPDKLSRAPAHADCGADVLSVSETRYRRLFEATRDGILILDPSTGKITAANPSAAKLLGVPQGECLRKELWEVGLLEDHASCQDALLRLRQDGSLRYDRLAVETRRGERLEIEFAGILYCEDRDAFIQCLLRDITERAAIEQKAALLAAIVEGSHDAIKGKTMDGIVTSWNPAAEMLYGYPAAEMIGQPIARLLPPDRPNEIDDLLKRVALGERVSNYETVRVAKDGRLVEISLTISPIRDSAGTVVGASSIARDITERKAVEQALVEAAAKNERIAETLQRSMLQEFPAGKFPGVEVQTLYEAALSESDVGGDFFDAFALSEGKIALVVGDVSGKGLAAAAHTVEVKYALRAFLQEYEAPEIALMHLNDFICETHRRDRDSSETFIVLALTVFDPVTGEATFSSAGAEPTLILRGTGVAEPVSLTGWPLGIETRAVYQQETALLAAGETILMATDGITEARRGRRFLGTDGLAELAERAGPAAPLRDLSQAIYRGARNFANQGLHDDVCLLLARRS